MRANFFVIFPTASIAGLPASHIAAFKAPAGRDRAGLFDNALVRLPQHHQRRRHGLDRAGAGRARPGDPCGGVPVRLHAGGRPVVLFAAVTATREAAPRSTR